jgi:hypothetical protein
MLKTMSPPGLAIPCVSSATVAMTVSNGGWYASCRSRLVSAHCAKWTSLVLLGSETPSTTAWRGATLSRHFQGRKVCQQLFAPFRLKRRAPGKPCLQDRDHLGEAGERLEVPLHDVGPDPAD